MHAGEAADGGAAVRRHRRWVDGDRRRPPVRRPRRAARPRRRARPRAWTAAEVEAALADHPRIGERARGRRRRAPRCPRSEQAGVDPRDAEVRAPAGEGNAAYEERFGRIYLVRAAGRSAAEMLACSRSGSANDPETELAVTAGQLREIALLRLEGLVRMSTLLHPRPRRRARRTRRRSRRHAERPRRRQLAAATTDADGRVRFDLELEPGHATGSTSPPAPGSPRPTARRSIPEVTLAFAVEPRTRTTTWRCCSARSPTRPTRGADWLTAASCWAPTSTARPRCRLVQVTRDTPSGTRSRTSTSPRQLRGDFEACHTEGDNSQVVATDTQKNTVYAFAREHGIGSPEEFLLTLGRHFVGEFPWVTGGRWAAEQYAWERIAVDGAPHDHSFVRTGQETRTAVVADRRRRDASSSPGSRTARCSSRPARSSTASRATATRRWRRPTDRILATSVTASWRYADASASTTTRTYDGHPRPLLATFADVHSLALQQTIFEMGKAVLERYDRGRRDQAVVPQQAPLPGRPGAVRPGQPGRGVLRRRPSLRADRGHRRSARAHRPSRGPGHDGSTRYRAGRCWSTAPSCRPPSLVARRPDRGDRAVRPRGSTASCCGRPTRRTSCPGVVDTHVHINEPGRTEWEGFVLGDRGGRPRRRDDAGRHAAQLDPADHDGRAPAGSSRRPPRGELMVDVGFWGGAVPDNLADLEPLWEAGVFGFKCFLVAVGRRRVPAAGPATQFYDALREIARFDGADDRARRGRRRPRGGAGAAEPGLRRLPALAGPTRPRPPRSSRCSTAPARPARGCTSCTCPAPGPST